MKKIMALLLVCSLVLAGCGKGESQNTPGTGSGGTGNQAAAEGESGGNDANTGSSEGTGAGGNNGGGEADGTGGNNGGEADEADGTNGSGYVYIPPEMKGEITIAVSAAEDYEVHGYLKSAVKSFMAKYPDVKVVLNEYAQYLPGQPWGDAYRLNINTRLVSGDAEDIIFIDGLLPADKYIRMGVPADLTPFIAATPEMNEANYYMAALTAGGFGNGIYVLPESLTFDIYQFDDALVNEGKVAIDKSRKSLSFSEFMALSVQMVEASEKQGAFVFIFDPEHYMQQLIFENLEQYIDSLNGVANLNTEEYIALLKQVKDFFQNKPLFTDGSDIDFYNDEYYIMVSTDSFPIQAAALYLNDAESKTALGFAAPLADAQGNVYLNGNGDFFLNNASPHKELAWEFIRFLLSYEAQKSPSFPVPSLPVNRKAAAEQLSRYYQSWGESGEAPKYSEAEMIALIDGWAEQINSFRFINPIILDWLYQENNKFFQGEQSAEETAQNLQTKITQYFNE